MSNSEFVGKSLNVVTRKGTEKVLITKELKTKGLVRDEAGNSYNIADITKRGRGLFIEMTKKPATTKPASAKTEQADNVRKAPTERPAAAAVTAAELTGKKINGVNVEKVLAKKGIVRLADGETVNLADVRRKGRGYTTEESNEEPVKKSGGATPKQTSNKAQSSAPLKVKGREIEVDGDLQVITNTYTNGMVKTDADEKFPLADIREIDGELVYQSAAYIEAAKKKAREESRQRKAAATPVEARELKDKKIAYGDKTQTVVRTFSKTGRVELDNGVKIDVADVVRKGRGYQYNGAVEEKRAGGAVPKKRDIPEQKPQRISVPAFTVDVAADIREIMKAAVAEALCGYAIGVAGVFASVDPNVLTVSFSLSASNANEIRVQQALNAQRKALKLAEGKTGNEEDEEEEENDGADFDSADLTGLDNDIPAEDEEEDEEGEEEDEEEDEEGEEPDEFDNEEDDEEEEEDENEPDEFESDEAEISFPENPSDLVEAAVGRLARMLPGSNLTAYVEKWYASQDVYDAIGYDLEPGQEIDLDGVTYVIVGLAKDGNPLLVNPQTKKSRAGATLDLLANSDDVA